MANLQIRMPIVVIGGGLTAIDTATESLAYYVVQVEKFLHRYEALVAEKGTAEVRAGWSEEDRDTAGEFITHGLRDPRRARSRRREGREPKLIDLLNSWGGVTVAYRRRMIDSPSYTLNHEEVCEGVRGRHPFLRVPVARRPWKWIVTATPPPCSSPAALSTKLLVN